jgi:hypothetical protein
MWYRKPLSVKISSENLKDILSFLIGIINFLIGIINLMLPLLENNHITLYESVPAPLQISTQIIGPISPLLAFGDYGKLISISAKIGNKKFDNIFIETAILKNIGRTPIRPEDTYAPLGLKVNAPWQIITIDGFSGGENVIATWSRVKDDEFRTNKILLNPGEQIWATIYLTLQNATPDAQPPIDVRWVGRIAGLSQLQLESASEWKRTVHSWRYYQRASWGIRVGLSGWGVPFFLAYLVVSELIYLRLLAGLRLLNPWGPFSYGMVLGATLLSVVAAESTSTFLIPSQFTIYDPIEFWLNAPWIALNGIAILALAVWLWASRRNRNFLLENNNINLQ